MDRRTIAHYEILEEIGAGGMGVVYRARDTRLDREVAVKALPEGLAQDAERLARFEREAKLLASLNHPHIAAIYGLEKADGQPFLILELVEGDTLAQRITRGPIPVEEALELGRQIAEALEAAHEQGVVHRDLKPANIKVTPEGQVKVLDFGLAKALALEPSDPNFTHSPTLTQPMTRTGVILGTAAYMSPEQARGQEAGKQADIWALGCVLYEMLTGKRAFRGETVSDTLAAILERQPDWEALPSATPPLVRRLLRRCLAKDPKRRLRDIGDASLELEDADEWWSRSNLDSDQRRSTWQATPWALTGILLIAIVVLLWQRATGPAIPSVEMPAHFEIELTGLLPIGTDIALSPDGRQLVYIGTTKGGRPALYLRSMNDVAIHLLRGTEGAGFPFFSPDSQWVGFHLDGELRKVPVGGGRPTVIAETPEAWGSSWSNTDIIVFGTLGDGLFQVPAAGGTPTRLTTPTAEDEAHVWPTFLPDGETILFTVWPTVEEDARIAALSLRRPEEWTPLLKGFNARFSPTGHLLLVRSDVLMGVPFDVREWTVEGEPTMLVEGLSRDILGWAIYEISESGRLIYLRAENQLSTSKLVWVDRDGNEEPVVEDQDAGFLQPAVSPSSDRLAFGHYAGIGPPRVFTYDLERRRRILVDLSQDSSISVWPVWSPDGKSVAFLSDRGAGFNVYRAAANGSGEAEQLTFAPNLRQLPTSWSVDDVLAIEQGPIGQRDILLLPMDGTDELQPFLMGEFHERGGRFSRDGRWLAFTSNRTGQDEVWVKAYAGDEPPVPISIGGGKEPVWSHDGRELFYRNGDRLLGVPIQTDPMFRPGQPKLLFRGDYTYGYLDWSLNYDVASDGRFVMVKEGPVPKLQVIVNWFSELTELVGRE